MSLTSSSQGKSEAAIGYDLFAQFFFVLTKDISLRLLRFHGSRPPKIECVSELRNQETFKILLTP